MATPGERKIKVRNLQARLDEKYDKEAKKMEMQPEKFDRSKQQGQLLFMKTVSDFRLLMAEAIPEADKFKKGHSIISSLKKDGNFDLLPADLRNDLSPFLEDEDTENKKQDKGKGSSSKPRTQAQDTVDAGSAKDLSPQQSMSSPSHSRKYDGAQGSPDTKTLKKEIETLKAQLGDEQEKSKKRNTELDELHKDLNLKEDKIKDCTKRYDQLVETRKKLEQEVKEKQERIFIMEKQLEKSHTEQFQLQDRFDKQTKEFEGIKKKLTETFENNIKLNKEKKQLEKNHEVHIAQMRETMADEKRKHDSEMQKLTKDRDDIRDRFSKLAGAKLSDQNADIADLSDPNRAMKLSERFGQLYDDEWTNAFETVTEKKMGLSMKEAIAFLLRLLQDCWSFCNTLLTSQMESLHNVFLHPSQNMAKIDPRKNVGGLKDRPRIGSKEDKTLRELRRMIGVGPSVIEEVKQSFLSEAKSWSKEKTGYDKKHIDACAPYIQKCAEVCWLMAVHDPPLYMKMDVKPGEKLDPNVYSVYSSSGNTIDFLVWPPLLNGKDGGLLAKGVAEPLRIVGKKK